MSKTLNVRQPKIRTGNTKTLICFTELARFDVLRWHRICARKEAKCAIGPPVSPMLKARATFWILPFFMLILSPRAEAGIPGDSTLDIGTGSDAALSGAQSGSLSNSLAAGTFSVIAPRPGQFDLQISGMFGFTGPGSIVRVREFQTEGTGLHFSSMDMNTEQMPTLDLRYWFNELNALHFRFRYFNIGGSHFSSTPILFNGSVIPGGRTNKFDSSEWFSGGVYYERRLTPLYETYEADWPTVLRAWDVRARIGIEFTYLDFSINGGTTFTMRRPGGEETKEDFYHQSMPLPTIGLEAYRKISNNFLFQTEVSGNWINRWNSLRNEGGTVWASQNGIEFHARAYYSNPRILGPIEPMVGFFVYTYSQLEDSHEDGNFIRWSSFGPELGINCSL